MSIPIIKPPFTTETALLKVKAAEDAWNTRDPEKLARRRICFRPMAVVSEVCADGFALYRER